MEVLVLTLFASWCALLAWLNQLNGRSHSEHGLRTVITPAGLDQLEKYKYKSSGYSWLDNIMNPWWLFFVSFVPLSIAPNVLTLTGLVCQFVSFGLSYYYAPHMVEVVPSWAIFAIVFLQFMYQTLDACDGKHARQTGAGSPLGQLFDHGCDSIGAVLVTLSTASVLRMGTGFETLFFLAIVQIPFFLAQWEEHHTHVLRTFHGYIGVTEAQFLNFGVLAATGWFGSDFWLFTLGEVLPVEVIDFATNYFPSVLHVQLNYALLACVGLSNLNTCRNNITEVFSNVPSLRPLRDLLPGVGYCAGVWYLHSTKGWLHDPTFAYLTTGLVFSHLTTQIIVCNVTHMQYAIVQPILAPLPLLVLNAHWAEFTQVDGKVLFDEVFGFQVYFVYVLILVLRYTFMSINQITKMLGIYCLTLAKRAKHKKLVR